MSKTKAATSNRNPASFTIGLADYAKIAAVEGLHLTTAMKREFRDFDRRGLSHDERRREITARYGKPAT